MICDAIVCPFSRLLVISASKGIKVLCELSTVSHQLSVGSSPHRPLLAHRSTADSSEYTHGGCVPTPLRVPYFLARTSRRPTRVVCCSTRMSLLHSALVQVLIAHKKIPRASRATSGTHPQRRTSRPVRPGCPSDRLLSCAVRLLAGARRSKRDSDYTQAENRPSTSSAKARSDTFSVEPGSRRVGEMRAVALRRWSPRPAGAARAFSSRPASA